MMISKAFQNKIAKMPQQAIDFICNEYKSDRLPSYQIARLATRLFKMNITNDIIPKIADLNNIPRRSRETNTRVLKNMGFTNEAK